MNLKYSIYLVILASIWGLSFTFVKIATFDFGPFPLGMLRIAIAAVLLVIFCCITGKLKSSVALLLDKKYTLHLIIVGVLGQLFPFTLYVVAEQSISASNASILNATTPIWTAIIAVLWLKKSFNLIQLLGIVLGFMGVFVLMNDVQTQSTYIAYFSVFAILLATLCYALDVNYINKFLPNVPPIEMATVSTVYAALLGLPLAIIYWPTSPISPEAWKAAIMLGVLCTGIASILFFILVANVEGTMASSVTFIIPVFGVIWGMTLLDEQLTLHMVVAIAIIISSIVLINRRKTKTKAN